MLTRAKRADAGGRIVAPGAKRAGRGEGEALIGRGALIARDTVAVQKPAWVAVALIVGMLRFHYGWERFGERIIGDVVDCGVTTVSMRARRWEERRRTCDCQPAFRGHAGVGCARRAMVEFATARDCGPCRGDEIGKHSGLKIRRLRACRFKSGPRHQEVFQQVPMKSVKSPCHKVLRLFLYLQAPGVFTAQTENGITGYCASDTDVARRRSTRAERKARNARMMRLPQGYERASPCGARGMLVTRALTAVDVQDFSRDERRGIEE